MGEPQSCSCMYLCFLPLCFSVEGKPRPDPGVLEVMPSCPTGPCVNEAAVVKIRNGRKTAPVCSGRKLGREDRVGV